MRRSVRQNRAIGSWQADLEGKGREMPVPDELLTLTAVAGKTVVAAATTDAWGKLKQGVARLLGRGDPAKTQVAEDRLEDTRSRLAGVTGAELESTQSELALAWQTRLADLLEEDPGKAEGLQILIGGVQAELGAGLSSASGHGTAAGRDIITAWGAGAIAAGTIHGGVSVTNPTKPGLVPR
jgi:hypothetical protein